MTALRWLDAVGQPHDYTYRDLCGLTNRFAATLRALGLKRGDAVFTLAGRIPELYVAILGTFKAGCVLSPMFSSFGPEPLRVRMSAGRARVLVTTARLYRQKIEPIRQELPHLQHILITDGLGEQDRIAGLQDFHRLLDHADPGYPITPTAPQDTALLHFTSGTTGNPKGALHVHEAVLAHYATARIALDLRCEDVFWCTADPGWVTGVSYGLIAPLSIGATVLVDSAEFEPRRWLENLSSQEVCVWYTAPTAVRMMMKLLPPGNAPTLPRLRFIASVGEPLNPEAVMWGVRTFGLALHDNWWQTETGAIMIANTSSADIKPGSMGHPLPGIEAAVVKRNDDGTVTVQEHPDAVGELALRVGWPSMFRGYLNDEVRYRACFVDGWYLSGDLARRDAEGYFWFVARADDIITSSGHRIGPFEVESVLMEHPAVAETGVIGTPDPVATERVKAFVSLHADYRPGEPLRRELLAHARRRLGAAVAPKEIEFRQDLPKTRSGKIMRRVLREQALAGQYSSSE
jgi:acetyl-CoA synthetase